MKKYYILSLIILTTPIVANANGDGGCFHMMDWYGFGGWGMFIFPFFWILLIGGIIFLAVKGFAKGNIQPPQEKSKSALEILKERYARGEINKENFEEMKKDIGE